MKFNTVNNKERRRRSAVSAVAQARSACNLHVLSTAFHGGHSLRLAFGSFFYPYPPLFFSTGKSVWQVAWFRWRGGLWLEGASLPAMEA